MEFSPWEAEGYTKLTKLYDDFFNKLAMIGKECFRIDAHELFNKNVKELSKKQKKEITDFWKKYIDDFDINYHKYYIDRTKKYDVRFIPDDIFAGYIDGYLNNREIEPGVADKNYFDLYLHGFKMPQTYIHLINGIYEDSNYNIITQEEALKILSKYKKVIVKPAMASYGGKGIKVFEKNLREELKEFLENTPKKNLIFQEVVEQSYETAKLHPQSLNTIRVMTLILNNDVKILPSAFRMGVGNENVDNASSGGIYCKINEDGTLSNFAYDALGNRFDKHPNGGNFSDVRFNFMHKIYKLVKSAAQRFPHFRLIGWDIGVDKYNNPIIIEANLTMSGLDVIETICGPLFGKYTEEVLDEVFNSKSKKERSMDISQYV